MQHSYKLFTIDKVIGALIKQVQVILSDPKSQDIYELLRKEREITTITTQDLINCRRNAERVLGPDENLFRVDWLTEPKTMTIQLIGKDDDAHEDTEAMTERWQAYIESFVSVRIKMCSCTPIVLTTFNSTITLPGYLLRLRSGDHSYSGQLHGT